ncbi:MAG: penicillin-binding transpeptidase domain-containing protein [Archangium sp.]
MPTLRVFSTAVLLATCVACASQARVVGPEGARDALCDGAKDCTIDLSLQRVVEAELDRLSAEPANKRAVIVMLDPSTGALLAMGGREGTVNEPWLAATRAVDPGSVMKSFTIAAALDQGVVEETTTVMGEGGKWRLGEKEIINDRVPRGEMSVEDVLVFSSNIGTAKVAEQLGAEPLAALYESLQLDQTMLPKMRKGHVPNVRTLEPPARYRVAFGADVEISPLQIAAAYGAFADEGRYHPVAVTRAGEKTARQAFTAKTATRMQLLLAQTVARDDGTGAPARLPLHAVAGKTGTWQIEDGVNWANFAGFPLAEAATQDRVPFVVYVGIETTSTGYSGGTLAAPSAARVISAALNPPPPTTAK